MLQHSSPEARATAALKAGDFPTAARLLRPLVKQRPTHAAPLIQLGVAEAYMGEEKSAERHLRRAIRLAPRNPEAHRQLAFCLHKQGRLDDAIASIEKAIALDPDHPGYVATKASYLFFRGDIDQAYDLGRTVLDTPTSDLMPAVTFARICTSRGTPDEAIPLVERQLETRGLAIADRASLLYALGDLRDAAGQYDAAFQAYREANDLRRVPFDARGFDRQVDGVIRAWTPERIAKLPTSRASGELPLLVVGMYRSGTSLVEQILASHPEAHGAGERPELRDLTVGLIGESGVGLPFVGDPSVIKRVAVDRAARTYLATLRKLAPSARRVVDKHPFNFVHLGVISLMLPGVRVIHTVRNPIDACVSGYFQNFAGVASFFNDLSSLGAFYRGYHRLMQHWRSVLELPLLHVVYEDLVADQETQTRRIVDFAGLDWDDACLRFHRTKRVTFTASNDQVRKPMYSSSVGRWRNYEKHLGPLIEALGDLAQA